MSYTPAPSPLPPFEALHETGSCHAHHDPVTLSLSVFLCVGLVVSYLPQLLRIILNRTSQGFSPWFLLLGATSSASSFLNVVALQWNVVRCCSVLSGGQCAESLLGIAQVGLQWLLFNSVFVLYLMYYPKELRYEQAIALPVSAQEDAEAEQARARARRAARKVAAKRMGQSTDERTQLLDAPSASIRRKGKRSGKSTDEDVSSGSENSDLDSVDSHIAQNYSTLNVPDNGGNDTSSDEGERDADEAAVDVADASAFHSDGSAFRRETSSSAFSRFAPAFWPMWKAPASGRGGMDAIEEGRVSDPAQKRQRHQELLAGAPRGLRRIDTERRNRLAARRVPKTRQRKTEEWGLAVALAWVVLIHFVFIASMTLLLVTSLPTNSFPPPEEVSIFSSGSSLVAATTSHHGSMAHAFGPSSRLLVSRWAVFLGTSAVVLAMGQYLPQIIYTARTQLVGSLSIPMMCLQVPGSAIFVYSLALQPGTGWSSLAAFILTGFFQLVLLVLCVAWRIRQHRAGIDDFGRPLTMVSL
ncbi:uncharacterized protein PFL1_00411 [Pseudozyma flocculosa PF-1]|uniref:Uncharacterized protein n=1 Tax=Pseudozyma flocculosa TaxID=84751 RepID=A0A5C3ERZ3_9BASI|nr:uncharacterized protein PFL1_00411 [Pseudozyma flocculosa PF-1]EPQ32214.1 hypothetical protein PFL1_00411 [Pseudozyma flocculosa PF-1]SPO34842.1 uncharacterized protein PSFLO_00313 [Pseudozyma flocculosa]